MYSVSCVKAVTLFCVMSLCFAGSARAASNDLWEPNNTRPQAVEVMSADVMEPRAAASLDSVGGVADDDWYYRFGGFIVDRQVSVWLEPIENPEIDTVVEIYTWNEPAPLEVNDDIRTGSPGFIRLSGIAGALVPQDVTPVIHVFPWNHSEVFQGGYRLNVLRMVGGPAFEDTEIEPNDTAGTATSFPIGDHVNGQIASVTDVDWFIVGKSEPRNEDILVVLQNRSGGSADFLIKVHDMSGIAEYTGVGLYGGVGEHDYLRIPFGSHTDDFIKLEVRSLGGTGDYRLFFGTGMAATCPVPFKSTPLVTIPDWANGSVGTVSSTIQVPPNSGTIANPRVYMDIAHDYLLDLEAELEHTNTGTKVVLFDNACETADNISTIFDDSAGSLPCPPILLSALPHQLLSAFNGELAEGDWTLTLRDVAPGSTGVLNQWCFLIPTPEVTQTPTPTDTFTATATPTSTRFFDCGSPYTSEPHAPIPDATDAVTGFLEDVITIADSRTISDLNVFVDITHPASVDLSITIERVETGLTASLYTTGCPQPHSDLSALFDDEGEPLFCPLVDPSRPVHTGNPFARLNQFDGQDLAGTWKLNIADLGVGYAGTLNKWCLIVAEATPTLTPTPSHTLAPTATETLPPCVNSPDLDGSGEIDASDLIELLRQLNGMPQMFGNGDLDCSGVLDEMDLLKFQSEWTH